MAELVPAGRYLTKLDFTPPAYKPQGVSFHLKFFFAIQIRQLMSVTGDWQHQH